MVPSDSHSQADSKSEPPPAPCGAHRAGVKVAPAVAADGTIYTVSRAHSNSRYGYLVAVTPT